MAHLILLLDYPVLYEDILKRITVGVYQLKQVSLYVTVYFGQENA